MSDEIGSPIFAVGDNDYREMFVERMRSFSSTISLMSTKSSGLFGGGSLSVMAMVKPYLAMVNLESVVGKFSDSDLCAVLDDTAEVAESDTDCKGILLAYLDGETLQLFTFDFVQGNFGNSQVEIGEVSDTVAGELFAAETIKRAVEDSAEETGMTPAWKSINLLTGLEVKSV